MHYTTDRFMERETRSPENLKSLSARDIGPESDEIASNDCQPIKHCQAQSPTCHEGNVEESPMRQAFFFLLQF